MFTKFKIGLIVLILAVVVVQLTGCRDDHWGHHDSPEHHEHY